MGVGVVRQDLVGDVVLNEGQCPERHIKDYLSQDSAQTAFTISDMLVS